MTDQLFSVSDQVVLISGGSRGIGRAIAAGFAERQARVIITGRNQESLEKTARELSVNGTIVDAMVCDVADPDAIHELVSQVIEKYNVVDTLINVAGVNRRKPAQAVTIDDYDFIMDINLKGAFLLSQDVGQHMLERGSGSQINIGSLNNERPLIGVLPYAMSKAGLGHMTRVLAMEWGARGVRVNGIAPGFILTDLTQKLWAQPEMKEWGHSNTPLKRLGRPEDMIGTAVFLASEASGFLTGQMIVVDGGFVAGLMWPISYDDQ